MRNPLSLLAGLLAAAAAVPVLVHHASAGGPPPDLVTCPPGIPVLATALLYPDTGAPASPEAALARMDLHDMVETGRAAGRMTYARHEAGRPVVAAVARRVGDGWWVTDIARCAGAVNR